MSIAKTEKRTTLFTFLSLSLGLLLSSPLAQESLAQDRSSRYVIKPNPSLVCTVLKIPHKF